MSESAVINYGLLFMYICSFTLFSIQKCFENITGFHEGRRKQRLKTKKYRERYSHTGKKQDVAYSMAQFLNIILIASILVYKETIPGFRTTKFKPFF